MLSFWKATQVCDQNHRRPWMEPWSTPYFEENQQILSSRQIIWRYIPRRWYFITSRYPEITFTNQQILSFPIGFHQNWSPYRQIRLTNNIGRSSSLEAVTNREKFDAGRRPGNGGLHPVTSTWRLASGSCGRRRWPCPTTPFIDDWCDIVYQFIVRFEPRRIWRIEMRNWNCVSNAK